VDNLGTSDNVMIEVSSIKEKLLICPKCLADLKKDNCYVCNKCKTTINITPLK